MSATYRTSHHTSGAPRFMRWIPKALQPLFLKEDGTPKDRITK